MKALLRASQRTPHDSLTRGAPWPAVHRFRFPQEPHEPAPRVVPSSRPPRWRAVELVPAADGREPAGSWTTPLRLMRLGGPLILCRGHGLTTQTYSPGVGARLARDQGTAGPVRFHPKSRLGGGVRVAHDVVSRSSRSRSQGGGCESKTSVEPRRARELDTLDHREAPARSHAILRRAWSWSGAATTTALRCPPTLGGIRDRRPTGRRGLATDLLRRSTRSRPTQSQ